MFLLLSITVVVQNMEKVIGNKGHTLSILKLILVVNFSSYVLHLQTHQDRKFKCRKCCCTFTTEKEVKAHVEKDHLSFKGFDGKKTKKLNHCRNSSTGTS